MKDVTRNRLKIASSLAMCLFSLFAVITATLSWFAMNDRTYGNGMSVDMYDGNKILGYEYLKVAKNGDGKYQLSEYGQSEFPSLGVYSHIDDEYQVVLKVYLTDIENRQIKISALTSTQYFLGESGYPLLPPRADDPLLPNNEGKNYNNVLSSIVSLGVLTESEVGELTGGGLATLPTGDRMSSFVDVNLADHTPSAELALKQSSADSDVISTQSASYNGNECEAVYILITYDSLLVSTVFSANIGNDSMYMQKSDGSFYDIPFVCDFSLYIEDIENITE